MQISIPKLKKEIEKMYKNFKLNWQGKSVVALHLMNFITKRINFQNKEKKGKKNEPKL